MGNGEIVETPEAMIDLGRIAGEALEKGNVLGLAGDLGSGKTTFVKGLVLGAGSDQCVTSPTFTLVHEYLDGRVPVFHFDFYRMESLDEALAIGWDEYLDGDGVVVVEWADKFPWLLPEHTVWRRFEMQEGGRRRVRLRLRPQEGMA